MIEILSALEVIESKFPGKAVELRIIGWRAISILEGVNHRRGTPPSVVEMDGQTFIDLLSKKLTFTQAVDCGLVRASGVRSDITYIFETFTGN